MTINKAIVALAMSVFVLVSSGCSFFSETMTIDGQTVEVQADSATDVLLVAEAEAYSYGLWLRSLVLADAIPVDTAQKINNALKDAYDAMGEATDAIEASGDPSQANSKLEAVDRALGIAVSMLAAYIPEEN